MKFRLLAISLFLALTIGSSALAEQESWYTDVENNHEYHDSIWYITTQEYAGGYEDGTFRPMYPINRAEALKIILNATGSTAADTSSTETVFTDISESDWFYAVVQEGIEAKIIKGYDDNTFRPENNVNRAEFLKMFLNAAQVVASTKVVDAEWYQKYIDYAITNALMSSENASEEISRGEVAEIIYRFNSNPYDAFYEYGKATWYHGNYNEYYDSENAMTAAHKELPFGTKVRVTNLATNLYTVVTINDRGPYGEGRIIDLTDKAFEALGDLGSGILNVKIEVLK